MLFWTAFVIHLLLGVSGVFAFVMVDAITRRKLWEAAFFFALGVIFAMAGGYALDNAMAGS